MQQVQTIKSENILKVIGVLKRAAAVATGLNHLEMDMSGVVPLATHESCGTPMCHAGWYAAVEWERATADFEQMYLREPRSGDISYGYGIELMRQDLEFTNEFNGLVSWTHQNPELWGNPFGDHVFRNSIAFYHPEKRPKGARTLQDIVDHWTEVYERVRATEQPEITEPPITAEELVTSLSKEEVAV